MAKLIQNDYNLYIFSTMTQKYFMYFKMQIFALNNVFQQVGFFN